jgi:hypothetical protein
MRPNVLASAVAAVLRCCLTFRSGGLGGREAFAAVRLGPHGCSKKWPKRSEQRSHVAASTMASCTHIGLVRAISHP